ncbi:MULTISPECIES: hypothetical protein [unclassified Mesorhizobium]|uniref:hypothetical protein n=1 Tax=unclassified Mesorhizobium TaxID=325217 RepID=UPI000FCC9B2E|nr:MULTISPECIES: hypothetical protein [unclassified Mesorhizobium]RUZ91487.1 hypothetical protein EN947_03630 [Mesorhizobium sp. M7A.F.Ca.US.003.02.2.1]RUY97027.1 hypothetical protein EN974_18285 [Mesorhizobium sp. M7A.F.Ca.CA.001.12.2.1]RUZ26101.1 hypothetical protein EN949_12760 [Mesorhizobium sp. M7A.F.Ca.US.007.01.2.1]RUZ50075.1 hypothetical protein EN948_02375 [Mesorhizobium sp. M7A.F.Ca.US.003.02.1.1]RUZ69568.1 hypothetical protein EN950_03995 [Mesorhizobium sp. M7A.F.Ca.US.007.01.1.1]
MPDSETLEESSKSLGRTTEDRLAFLPNEKDWFLQNLVDLATNAELSIGIRSQLAALLFLALWSLVRNILTNLGQGLLGALRMPLRNLLLIFKRRTRNTGKSTHQRPTLMGRKFRRTTFT